jgi:hypothetical protein
MNGCFSSLLEGYWMKNMFDGLVLFVDNVNLKKKFVLILGNRMLCGLTSSSAASTWFVLTAFSA